MLVKKTENVDNKRVHTMCEVAERLENKGRAKGRAEERIKTILKLYHKGNTVEEIVEFYENDFSAEDIQIIIKNYLEGRAEGETEFIQQMLRNGKTAEQIVDFCGMDLEEIRKIEKNMYR